MSYYRWDFRQPCRWNIKLLRRWIKEIVGHIFIGFGKSSGASQNSTIGIEWHHGTISFLQLIHIHPFECNNSWNYTVPVSHRIITIFFKCGRLFFVYTCQSAKGRTNKKKNVLYPWDCAFNTPFVVNSLRQKTTVPPIDQPWKSRHTNHKNFSLCCFFFSIDFYRTAYIRVYYTNGLCCSVSKRRL